MKTILRDNKRKKYIKRWKKKEVDVTIQLLLTSLLFLGDLLVLAKRIKNREKEVRDWKRKGLSLWDEYIEEGDGGFDFLRFDMEG